MRPEDLVPWLRAMPFQPFRIHLNSGRSYDIRHPEMLRVGRTKTYVFGFGEAPDVHEQVEMVSNLLLERVVPLETRMRAET